MSIEMLEVKPGNKEPFQYSAFSFRDDPEANLKKGFSGVNPQACIECHKRQGIVRPIWDVYNQWPGFYGTTNRVPGPQGRDGEHAAVEAWIKRENVLEDDTESRFVHQFVRNVRENPVAAQVAADKYDMHLPLERQRRQMEALGLNVSAKTLYGLCRALAELCERTVVPKIRKEILSDFASVHVDKTPWALLGGRGGYMWTLSNRSGAYYRFEPTRSGKKEALHRFRDWLIATRTKHLPEAGLTKAIDYCLKLWPGLSLFTTDLSVPLTNNDAERALRHVVVGRKNFLGSKSVDGADTAATLYTVIESAKRVGMVPRGYLEYVADTAGRGHDPLSPLELAWAVEEQIPAPQPDKNDWKI